MNDIRLGLEYSQMAINKSKHKDKNKPLYFYLSALCNKLLGNFKEAEKDYNKFCNEIAEVEENTYKNFTFGIILGLFTKNNKITITQLKKYDKLYKELRGQYSNIDSIPTGLSKYWNNKGEWNKEKQLKLIRILSALPFFRRFSKDQLEYILSSNKYAKLPANRLILLKKDEVAVIVSGEANIYSYSNGLYLYETITRCNTLIYIFRTWIHT